MLRFAIAFLAGICCIHLLPALPAVWPCALIATVLLIAAAVLRSSAGIAMVLGLVWAWGNAAARLQDDLPAAMEGTDLIVRGQIASLPKAIADGPQFDLDVSEAPAGVPDRIRLSWYEATTWPAAGESWNFVVRLKRRNGFANPGGYDYEAQLFREGVGATGYVRNDARNVRLTPPQPQYAVLRLREWIAARIHRAVGDDPMLGILQGLAVGETQAMSPAQWRVLSATGLTHLMAISGLHITMLAALAAWAGGQIVRWPEAQRRGWTAIEGQVLCGLTAALIYSTLAGMSVPTQRTLVMLGIAFAARALRRDWTIGRMLAVALIAVLMVDPFAPLASGAWLSFGAVAVILFATAGRRSRDGVLKNFTRVQVGITVGLTPVIVTAFGALSLVSPVTNALAAPLFTLLIVPAVLAGTLLASLWLPAGALVLGLVAEVLNAIWPFLAWAASLPLSLWHFPSLPVVWQLGLLLGSLVLVLPGIAPSRMAATMLCLPALFWRPEAPRAGEFRIALLDVGQGLATVVRTRSHVLVFDAGPAFRSGRDTGEMVVLPYLRSQGFGRIDAFVVSHGDMDHQGGMQSLLEGRTVDRLLVGPSVSVPPGYPATVCAADQHWQWDGVEFHVLHPSHSGPATQADGDNDSSCVIRISGAGGSALLTGDIQRDSESALVSAGIGRVDVVVAPHHGSRTSSTPEFVQATAPQVVLFAAGYRNRWGFPKPDVVERWQAAGARAYSTQSSGAIELAVAREGLGPIQEFRKEYPRYWRAR